MLTAITRKVGPDLQDCELTYIPRQEINIKKANEQHQSYEELLRSFGANVISLPAESGHPDAVFVEDPTVVLDEVAVITTMGSDSRKGEVESLLSTLSQFRTLEFLTSPANFEGGDVLRVGRTLYVGKSSRTNSSGIKQIRDIVGRFDYEVRSIDVTGCLHLKTGCTFIGRNTVLANPSWVDAKELKEFDIIEVPTNEPGAGNALLIDNTVVIPNSFPETLDLLKARGFEVKTTDISELLKAEAGLTCMSILFEDKNGLPPAETSPKG